MDVRRLPKDPGPAAWNALLPSAASRPVLKEHAKADWLVIGAGFTGLSAARRLAELHPGDRIVVLDATTIADGPAGRNSGFMIDLPHDLTSSDYRGSADKDQRDTRLSRAGISYALDAKSTYGMSDEAIVLSGKINGAVSARGVTHNNTYAAHLDSLSEPYERLDAKAMQSLTGSPAYIDGLFSPGTAMLQPALYIRELARGIESNHVHVYERTPVVKLEQVDAIWKATTRDGSVVAPNVILAVNGHLESFGFYQQQLMHVFTYASMTDPLSKAQLNRLGGEPRWALTPADAMGTTVRRIADTGGHRLIIRNRATFDPTLEVSDARIEKVARTHDQSFRYRFPMLDDVKMAFSWGGRLCLSRNNVPAFGEIDQGLYAACCQNGLGTAKGTIAGKLAAELASGERSSLLDDIQADEQPTRLPPAPIAALGGNAVLRWGEWRAGKEL